MRITGAFYRLVTDAQKQASESKSSVAISDLAIRTAMEERSAVGGWDISPERFLKSRGWLYSPSREEWRFVARSSDV